MLEVALGILNKKSMRDAGKWFCNCLAVDKTLWSNNHIDMLAM